uniref:Uncharacterized protein n=1 Tax=Bracon brevicornis TaxID=1563983 RepID=A0A6V7JJ81_9HYME
MLMHNRGITKVQPGDLLRSDQFHTASDVETTASGEVERSNIRGYAEELIINGLPKMFKGRGSGLLKFMKNTDSTKRLTWNSQEEVILDGKKIDGSNIVDLVNDGVRFRKTFNPEGRVNFTRYLKSIKAPRDFAGNRK